MIFYKPITDIEILKKEFNFDLKPDTCYGGYTEEIFFTVSTELFFKGFETAVPQKPTLFPPLTVIYPCEISFEKLCIEF